MTVIEYAVIGGKPNHSLLGSLKEESFGDKIILYDIWQLQQTTLRLSFFPDLTAFPPAVFTKTKNYLVPSLLSVWLYTDTHTTILPPSPTATHSPSLRNRPLQMSLPCWLGKPLCHSCRSSLWKNPAKSLLFGFCSSQWPLHRRKHGEYDFDRHAQHGSMEWFLQSHHRARSEKQVKVQKQIIFYVASKAQLALQTSNSENAKPESLIELKLSLGSGWMLIVKISKHLNRRSSFTIDSPQDILVCVFLETERTWCASSYTAPHRHGDTEKIPCKTDFWFDAV